MGARPRGREKRKYGLEAFFVFMSMFRDVNVRVSVHEVFPMGIFCWCGEGDYGYGDMS